jgi:DMSO/TMAO reductase YedYZ heme-binding membrane subunit
MKTYFLFIRMTQRTLLAASIAILALLPAYIAFSGGLSESSYLSLFTVAHVAVFFTMAIRPLADIMPRTRLVRPLVILRKGAGVLSASIIVSFLLAKLMVDPVGYSSTLGTAAYWSLSGYALLAHLADISAMILLVTSNDLSKRLLGKWWKRVQRLSYAYFYASSLYVLLALGNPWALIPIVAVTWLTAQARGMNLEKARTAKIQQTT